MTGFSATVEIGFDAGVFTPLADVTWTDVSEYQDGDISVTWGRADQFSSPEPLTCSLTLRNEDGRFTPGRTSSPYYPNVRLNRAIRVTVTPGEGDPSVRFVGYINEWPVEWPGGTDLGATLTRITASSRTSRLALRNSLRAEVLEAAVSLGATYVFPMDAQPGAKGERNAIGDGAFVVAGSGSPVRFSGSAVRLSGGKYLTSRITLPPTSDYTLAISFKSSTTGALSLLPLDIQHPFILSSNDGQWHRLTVAHTTSDAFTVWLDGQELTTAIVLQGNTTRFTIGKPSSSLTAPSWIRLAGATSLGWGSLRRPSAMVRDVVYYPTPLSSGDVAVDYAAFKAGYGDRTDTRLERYATYAGLAAADVDADTGVTTMGATDINGMAVLDAFRVVESTEGGVLTDARDGKLRLIGRRVRYNSTPAVSLAFSEGEVGADYSPRLSPESIVNEVTGTNSASDVPGGDAETVSFTARNTGSRFQNGNVARSIEVNDEHPTQAYAAASWWVEQWADPTPSFPNVTVDLLPMDLTKTAACLDLFIGDRIELTDRPQQDATSSVEAFVENGTENYGSNTFSMTLGLSPIGLADSVLILDAGHEFNSGKHWAY